MATFDMTSKATVGVDSDSIAAATSRHQAMGMYMREARLDIAKMVEDGYSCTNGDIFQLLEIPANTLVLFAGAEVETAFNGTSPTVDIDFAAGDDIVDGGDVSSAGFLASGTNGQSKGHVLREPVPRVLAQISTSHVIAYSVTATNPI